MQRGPDSVWIDPLDVIDVGRWRLLKAHRLQDRWIGMFHVKHRSINCVHELVRWIVRGRTYGINRCAHHAVALQPELCAVVWWIAYSWIPVDRWCRVVCWRPISQWERKFRIQNKRARAWCAYEGNSCITSDMQEYFRGRKAIKTQFDIDKGMLDTQQRGQVHHVVPICLRWHGKIDSLWTTQSAMNCVDDNSHSSAPSQPSCQCFTWNIDIRWLIIGCNTDRANQGLAPLIPASRN